jgi:hypothetical protein
VLLERYKKDIFEILSVLIFACFLLDIKDFGNIGRVIKVFFVIFFIYIEMRKKKEFLLAFDPFFIFFGLLWGGIIGQSIGVVDFSDVGKWFQNSALPERKAFGDLTTKVPFTGIPFEELQKSSYFRILNQGFESVVENEKKYNQVHFDHERIVQREWYKEWKDMGKPRSSRYDVIR